jgi:rhomboid protease GluP
VFGVVGAMAWLVLKSKGKLEGFTGPRMLIFVLLSVYAGFADQGVDNAAHVAGLLSGFLLAMLFCRKRPAQSDETEDFL